MRRCLRRMFGLSFLLLASLFLSQNAFGQVVRNGAMPMVPLFPADNWWNADISSAPVDSNSANFINYIGAMDGLHPDFGGDNLDDPPHAIYGMVYIVVPGTQPLEPVTFVEYGDESDAGAPGRPPGYPIPAEARTGSKWIEAGYPADQTGGDRHMLIVDRDNRILYELYHTRWNAALGRWEAGSGAVFPLDSNARRPEGWTSADAAGLAITPGLVRYDEVYGAEPIRHAFRVTVRNTNGHVFPASHTAGSSAGALPMGARLRLKASVDISGYPADVRKIFQAMKTYGLIVADNGSDMYVTGAYDTRWNNDVLNPAFDSLTAGDFEVVQLGWQPAPPADSGALDFYTLTPCRLLDTRNASGPWGGPGLAPGGQRVVAAAGRCGIPATARALSVNVTVVGAAGQGHLRFFPGDGTAPATSTINFSAGQTRANNAILKLAGSGSGTLGIHCTALASSPVHAIVDVNGYYQ